MKPESRRFAVGDLVTRDGSDVQRVLAVEYEGGLITVICIKEPLGLLNEDGSRGAPWCRVGDVEDNLSRRYDFAGPLIEHINSIRADSL